MKHTIIAALLFTMASCGQPTEGEDLSSDFMETDSSIVNITTVDSVDVEATASDTDSVEVSI